MAEVFSWIDRKVDFGSILSNMICNPEWMELIDDGIDDDWLKCLKCTWWVTPF